MSAVVIPMPATTEQAELLTAAGFTPLALKADEPAAYWVPPSGGTPLSARDACAMVVAFWNTSRKALLAKPFWQTSEFWLAASGPLLAAPMAVAGLAGAADFLGPPWSGVITGFCGFVAVASPAAYKIARHIAKHFAAKEGKQLPADVAPAGG